MRLIFAGTPPFAATALNAIHAAGHEIVLVLTQPDRQSGRGLHLMPSATAEAASKLGSKIEKPHTLKSADVQILLKRCNADAMIVAAYGLILPQAVLDIPKFGCLNIHGSLLPRWRGAAPVQRAIEEGDHHTGITIMQMDAGLDTGDILLEKHLPIAPDDTSATLFAKLSILGARTTVDALSRIEALVPRPQGNEGMTYAKKIEKAEARIDFSLPAAVIERKLRAFDPFPGCDVAFGSVGALESPGTTSAGGKNDTLKIWRATVIPEISKAAPGTIVVINSQSLYVSCGDHLLSIQTVQKPGGKRLAIADYLHGLSSAAATHIHPKVGDIFT